MEFEWDSAKDKANRTKHGVSFELAQLVFDDSCHLSILDCYIDGEERWQTLGLVEGVLLLLAVHTYLAKDSGEEVVRIISARKATTHERRQYEQTF